MKLVLIRHGACELLESVLVGRKLDVALTTDGIRQVRALAHYMAGMTVDVIHNSPRVRTRQTAALLMQQFGVAASVQAALDEIDFGDWEGKPFNQLADDARWRRWNAARELQRPPGGGETTLEAQTRVIEHIAATHAGDAAWRDDATVVMVTHAEIIRCVVMYYLGMPLGAYQRIEVRPAAMTTLLLGDCGSKLLSLNECAT